MKRSTGILLWLFAILMMGVIFVYQRTTGPTYPFRGEIRINDQTINYRLPRSHTTRFDSLVEIKVNNESIQGRIVYKRFKSYDRLDTIPMLLNNGFLAACFPDQPYAGKIQYKVILTDNNGNDYQLSDDFIVTRFKGKVPLGILLTHIAFMVMAMIFSFRTGLEALFKGRHTFSFTIFTLIFLFLGGLIFGPIVQKYAFDAYWTGWPWGHDLTDNKTAVSFLFWLIAFFVLKKNPKNVVWPLLASAILLLVYLIPHSVLGSEIDHTALESAKNATLLWFIF